MARKNVKSKATTKPNKSSTKSAAKAKAAPIRKGGKPKLVEPQLVHSEDIDPRIN